MEGGPSKPVKQTDIHLQKTSDEYTVGWICAICTEYVAAQAALDEEHKRPSHVAPGDQNDYAFGRIGIHNVVIAVLPDGEYGVDSAAIVARDMMHSFANIKVGLMVGVGGGAPSIKHDIRLGDIVVGVPRDGQSGVLQYGFGKAIQGQPFQATRLLNQSPRILRAAISGLQSQHRLKGYRQLREIIDGILKRNSTLRNEFARPDLSSDVLYRKEIIHPEDSTGTQECSLSCGDDPSKLVVRPRRIADEGAPVVHYRIIASSNTLMKDAMVRDKYALEKDVLCFEMEAAGLMNQFPCLVVRGISDYSDSHKNKHWQGYAALAAAAYAKDLLYRILLGNTSIAQRVMAREEKAQIFSHDQKKALLKSLKFDQHNLRHDLIRAPHAGTCKCVQESAEYMNWIDPDKINNHHGFLCVQGHPGAGKSTLMKSALVNARETMGDGILLSFFFNVHGDDLEKSTLGMYRSLLLQLFQQLPALQDALDISKFTAYNDEKNHHQWHIEPLKSLFHQAIEKIQTSKVVCFIDALDECDEDQARDMISFFQNLSVLATSRGFSFLVCCSRRRYPTFLIPGGLNIYLAGNEHAQDINKYMRDELKIGYSDVANQIHADIVKRSRGIFTWVNSIISILNKEYDKGRVHNLPAKYQEIPGRLLELFKNVFTRNSDSKSMETLRCFQLLLFSRELLRPEQVYYAVLSESFPLPPASKISFYDMERFIINASLGLAAIVAWISSGLEVPRMHQKIVLFIHPSVRDFLFKHGALGEMWPGLGDNIPGQSHEYLKQCCLKWIKMGTTYFRQLLLKNPCESMASLQLSASNCLPFLEYAVGNVLYYANAAQTHGVSQAEFLNKFKPDDWMMLRNIFEIWDFPSNTRLLYVLAELNMGHLIGPHPSKLAFSEVGDEYFGTPLFAALANGSNEAILEFLKAQAESTPEFHDLYEEYRRKPLDLGHFRLGFTFSRSKNILSHFTHPDEGNKILQVAFLLSMHHPYLNWDWTEEWSQSPLLYVYNKGNKALLGVLIEKCISDVDEIPCFSSALLRTAAKKGHGDFVELLLQKGANIDARDSWRRTALHEAVEENHQDGFQLLIKAGADIEATGFYNGITPLSLAAARGHVDIAAQLIKLKAKIEARDGVYDHTPLMLAAKNGHNDMVALLHENGCNIEAKTEDGETPLRLAVEYNRTSVVIQLLARGADIEAIDEEGQTPLILAIRRHRENVAIQLLDKGSNIEAMDKNGQTPLTWAIITQEPGLVRLLLNRGAKVTAEIVTNVNLEWLDFDTRPEEKIRADSELTLLEFAQQFKKMEIIELLSRNGAS